MYLSAEKGRGVNKRLRGDPRISTIDFNESYPTAYVIVEGRAVEVEDLTSERHRALFQRYMDPSRPTLSMKELDVEAFYERWRGEGRVLWRIDAGRMVGFDSAKKGDAAAQVELASVTLSEVERLKQG
jgi:hypothetical protein